ncbi:hypothetical protein [Alkaliphilus peptidifermentans]|uniref:Uncharacterized protein n=1 Tax=Alkaliphilus peptidifermentans DSM 18978 TaxID=1120976 RepID=A0A1G5JXP7_9FIRM|nr:hypothetical protein [Alkaliphilus peptidifermentans]SCY93096.1 hypothetical protein SAMN03080606_03104 [Alkaliphilus peptidifermentans DSM 18978]
MSDGKITRQEFSSDVNEEFNKIGNMQELETTNSSNLVNAVNEVKSDIDKHKVDYVRQPGYGITGGTSNNYTLTLDPPLTSYTPGICVAIKIHTANSGASTLNINGLGAKSIRDSRGNILTTGKLILNGVYTLRYDGSNFQLQGEGASGNATASDLLSGKTASTDAGDIIGTMSNKGAKTFNPSASVQSDTAGYYSSVTCNAVNVPAANVLSGTTIAGTAGSMVNRGNVTSALTSQGGQYTIPQGYHAGAGTVTANITNLSSGNVRKGAEVGGVTGTYSDMPTGEVPTAGDISIGKSAFANGGNKIIGTMPIRTGHVDAQAISRSGTTLRLRPQAGYYGGSSSNSVQLTDANYVAENIKKDISLFGLTGSLKEGIFALLTPDITHNLPVTTVDSITSISISSSSLNFKPTQIVVMMEVETKMRYSEYYGPRDSEALGKVISCFGNMLTTNGYIRTHLKLPSGAYEGGYGILSLSLSDVSFHSNGFTGNIEARIQSFHSGTGNTKATVHIREILLLSA